MKSMRYAALNINFVEEIIPLGFSSPLLLGSVKYELIDSAILIDVPKVSRYAILKSGKIIVEAASGASETSVELYLEGLALPVMALHRGMTLFHGSAVERNGRGIVILGDKGAGKSTTAAALAQAGCSVLCDDTVPVSPDASGRKLSDGPFVAPGIPRPMLLPDAFQRIGGEALSAEVHARYDGAGKYAASVPAAKEAAPLGAVFILAKGNTGSIETRMLRGADKIKAAMAHSLRLPGIEEPAAEFARSLEMLRGVRIFSLTRPASEDSLDEVVARILALSAQGG